MISKDDSSTEQPNHHSGFLQ